MKRFFTFILALFTITSFSQKKKDNSSTPKFILYANVGLANRLAKTPNGLSPILKDYVKDLKSGISYDISVYYTTNNGRAFGLKYNVFKSSGSVGPTFLTTLNGESVFTTTSDDITISFIGPAFSFNDYSPEKIGEFNMELSLGYMAYKNETNLVDNYTIKGANLGIVGGFGYHFKLFKNLYFGPQLNFVGGVLNKFKITGDNNFSQTITLKDDEKESLWRIDISAGLKYRL